MNIGKTIKRLRREQNMTQEKLADFLSISPQAVSRWENGLAMPELTLVPVIANLFGVTTDLLFGLDSSDVNAAIGVIIAKSENAENPKDHNAASISILKDGIARFPSNWILKNTLIEKYYVTYAEYRDELDRSFLDDAVLLGNEILDNCTVDEYRYSAIEILSSIYAISENKEKAIQTAKRFPAQSVTGDKLLMALLEGEDKVARIKDNILSYAEMLCVSLRALAFSTGYSANEKLLLLKKIEGIFEILYEEQSDFDTELMCNVHRYIAAVYADEKDAENTLYHLNKEAEILAKIGNSADVVPSIIRKEHGDKKIIKKSSSDVHYLADELLYKLDHERYDFIRDQEGYVCLIEKLENIINDN